MTRSRFFLSALLLGSVFTAPLHAQEKNSSAPVKTETAKPAAPTGVLKEWKDAEAALIKPLSQKDRETFFILSNKHSFIRVIGVVKRDIGAAVDACGDANKDIKDKMNDRFEQWKGSVLPIISTAQKQLDKDIDAQTAIDPKKLRAVLKLNDAAYEDSEKGITKKPVSTPEACQDLLASMDRTEDDMITLLQQTLLPESAIRSRVVREKAAEAPKPAKAAEKAPDKAEKPIPSKKQ